MVKAGPGRATIYCPTSCSWLRKLRNENWNLVTMHGEEGPKHQRLREGHGRQQKEQEAQQRASSGREEGTQEISEWMKDF
jgi:hypothetical protein